MKLKPLAYSVAALSATFLTACVGSSSSSSNETVTPGSNAPETYTFESAFESTNGESS